VPPPTYVQPTILADALAALAQAPLVPLAGGTDFYPARVGCPVSEGVLDLSRIAGLRGIERAGDTWRLGALTTWSDLRRQPVPGFLRALRQAAGEVGGVQVQNAGTIGGNLCNASPGADGVPPLLALSAQVELARVHGVRTLPLAQFILGNRRTARAPDELLTAILLPGFGARTRTAFRKLGARRYLVISIVMVAARVDIDASGRIMDAAVAVGACSEVAQRLPALERRLIGRLLAPDLSDLPQASDLAILTPRSDVRGSAEYRLDAGLSLVRRTLGDLFHE